MNGSPTAQLQAFAQSVYLMIKNRYYSSLTTPTGQTFLSSIVDWANMYIDELETEITSDGDPIDWIWVRQPNTSLGTATYIAGSVTQPSITWNSNLYNNLCSGTERFVQVLDPLGSGNPVSNFTVVAPDDISNNMVRNDIDMCTLINGNIYFSRPFNQNENGGAIVGDVTTYLPRITTTIPTTGSNAGQILATNVSIFTTIKPLALFKLGVAKNAILPDIVMGGLQPSYVQKYNDLLTNAINQSTRSAVAPTADYDNMETMVHGVGF
jgi:hypothetical protein